MKFKTENSSRTEGKVVQLVEDYGADVNIMVEGIIVGRFDSDSTLLIIQKGWLEYCGLTLKIMED